MSQFGETIKKNDFSLEPGTTFINQGSYGCVSKPVQAERIRLLTEMENHPDEWFRRTHKKYTEKNIIAAARFLGSDTSNLVFVKNATTGCNCVLKSLPFQPGDGIVTYSYTYKAVYNACLSAAEKSGAEVLTLQLNLNISSEDELVQTYRKFLMEHRNIKLVLLDYISSPTAILFPIRRLIKLCKEYGAMVLLDGAHVPGQLSVNLEELAAIGLDFFTGNFHKWVFTPRGCAVLWVNPKHHHLIKPVVTSHSFHTSSLYQEFLMQGTLDNTPYFCLGKALTYYEDIGGLKKISSYASDLLDKACKMLCEAWGTELFPIPDSMRAPYMRLVEVPKLKDYHVKETEVAKKNCKYMTTSIQGIINFNKLPDDLKQSKTVGSFKYKMKNILLKKDEC